MNPADALFLALVCVCFAAMFATGFVSDWLDRLAARRLARRTYFSPETDAARDRLHAAAKRVES